MGATGRVFPSYRQTDFTWAYDDQGLYRENRTGQITIDRHGDIAPFAQSDVINSFIQGANQETLKDCILAVNSAFDEFKKLSNQDVAVSSLFTRMNEVTVEAMKKRVVDRASFQHYIPFLQAVAMMPKAEMAELAESLVNLTSLKRKSSHAQETVGGPTDVAVITKWDGFIWVRRKHYFEPELNPNFVSRPKW